MLKQLVLFSALLILVTAFVERAELEPVPAKFKDQKGCYIKELDMMLPLGHRVASKKRCVEYVCSEDIVSIYGCSVSKVEPPCFLETDATQPYPGCCPQSKCPEKH